LPVRTARLAERISGQRDWTQFIEGHFEEGPDGLQFRPAKQKSRLQSMADAEGFVCIPEGVATLEAGTSVMVQLVPYAGETVTPPGF
jgi:molybdopterin biosynthesis enzyme